MRWFVFSIVGLVFLSIGVILLIVGPRTPVYYAGGGISIGFNGTVVHGTAPTYCEIPVSLTPNTLHVRIGAEQVLSVKLTHPNGTIVAVWENETVYEDYVLFEVGLWRIRVIEPESVHALGEIFTTAPLLAHPSLIYAPGPILLGSLSLLYSKSRRRLESYYETLLFEQNIGGRWILLAWIPILAFISYAPHYIPRFPWLYILLIMLTVIAVFSSTAFAYVKLCISKKGLLLEAPFLNFSKHYSTNEIYGYTVKKVKEQRWFFLRPIPSLRGKKEDEATISVLTLIPKLLWVLTLGSRISGSQIIFRPKSLQDFTLAMDKLDVVKKDSAAF
ncbi:MAG: hypothetical protein OEX01_06220 [Candidatus Bathyarchaeota archaeon]|nr:hypothetical protein [Candidatus Bathyarchaeota archaeon]